jgi:tetratricopeptide (TPR) repeat protein
VKAKPRAHAIGSSRRIDELPMPTQRLLRQAQRAIDARRPARAQTALLRAQPACAGHPEFLRLLGLLRHQQKRHKDALRAFRRALASAPAEPLLLTHLGATLRASGELAAAESVLRLACRLAPDLADAWHQLGRLLSADARPAEAADAHARAARCDPGHLEARLAHADCLRTQGLIAEAAAGYRALLKNAPRQVRAWSRLANLKTVRFDAGETAALETLRRRSKTPNAMPMPARRSLPRTPRGGAACTGTRARSAGARIRSRPRSRRRRLRQHRPISAAKSSSSSACRVPAPP